MLTQYCLCSLSLSLSSYRRKSQAKLPLIISETTLQLEALVGDLEDAVLCFVNSHSGKMFSANPSVATGTILLFFSYISMHI